MEFTTQRKRKSEKLTTDERKRFAKYVDSFDTKIDCAEDLQISRVTLDRLIFKGSGKPEIIQIVREKIAEKAA